MVVANLALVWIIFLTSTFAAVGEGTALAVGCACVIVALGPLAKAFTAPGKKQILTCFVVANLAPVWFLYLEGILRGGDAREHLPPDMRLTGYMWACVYAAIYNSLYCLNLRHLAPHLTRHYPMYLANTTSGVMAAISILFFWLPMVVIGSRYETLAELWRSLTAGRIGGEGMGVLLRVGAVGGGEAFYQPLMWLFQLTPLVAAMAVDSANREKQLGILPLCAMLFGSAVMFFYFLGGSRGQFIQVIGGPVGILFYRNMNRGWLAWSAAAAGFFLLIGMMELQVRARGNILAKLSNAEEMGATASDGALTTFNPTKSHRDNNLYLTCLIVNKVPSHYPFTGLDAVAVDLCNPIPRAIWPNKPSHHEGDLGSGNIDEVLTSGPIILGTSSLSTSIVGDFYRMAGVYGYLLIAGLYSTFHAYMDTFFLRSKRVGTVLLGVQAAACFFALWGFRAFGTFVTMGYPFFLVVLVLMIVGRKGARRFVPFPRRRKRSTRNVSLC